MKGLPCDRPAPTLAAVKTPEEGTPESGEWVKDYYRNVEVVSRRLPEHLVILHFNVLFVAHT